MKLVEAKPAAAGETVSAVPAPRLRKAASQNSKDNRTARFMLTGSAVRFGWLP